MEPPHDARNTKNPSPIWIAVGAIALLVALLFGSALRARPAVSLQVGSPVPDLTLTALDGSPMDLSAQRGKVVVINLFASWCPPCRQEAADLEQVWRKYQDRPVQFFGIAYKDTSTKALAFLQEFGISYPNGMDPDNRIARAYGVTGVPETFIIDPQGRLVRHILGPITAAELSRELDRLLGP